MTPASVKVMLKRQITSTEPKIYKYNICYDVKTGVHNIYVNGNGQNFTFQNHFINKVNTHKHLGLMWNSDVSWAWLYVCYQSITGLIQSVTMGVVIPKQYLINFALR